MPPGDNSFIDKRPNYFAGQFLLEEDFQDEQNYHINRQRHQSRLLTVSGISEGLKIESASSNPAQVTVNSGIAIDDQGRQIVWAGGNYPGVGEPAINNDDILYIIYHEELSKDDTQAGTNEARRWQEKPRLSVVKSDGAIALSQLTVANGVVTENAEGTKRVRQYSGLRLPSSDAANAPTLRSDGNSNPSLAVLQGNLRVAGNTTIGDALTVTGTSTLSGALTVTSTSTLTGKLTVNNQVELKGATNKIGLAVDSEGKVGIGTSNPQASLSIGTPESYGGDTIRFEAKAEPDLYNLSLNTEVTDSNVRWVFDQVNNRSVFRSVLAFDRGNVGIGIANPQARLDVRSSSIGSGTLTTVGTTVTGRNTEFQTQLIKAGYMVTAKYSVSGKSYTETRRVTAIASNSSLTVDFPFTTNITTPVNFTFQPPLLAVQNDKVGIGTINPSSTLSVAGGVAIGAEYATETAPANGLIVEGKVGIGTSTLNADLKLQVLGGFSSLQQAPVSNTFDTIADNNSGWQFVSADNYPCYYKDSLGIVHLTGYFRWNGPGPIMPSPTTIFTLSERFRPVSAARFPVVIFGPDMDSVTNVGIGMLRIDINGKADVIASVPMTLAFLSLDSIAFRVREFS